ncbi:hypothetical protein QR680_012056 [Steinernema hermaphroditum]|uniref:C2H2-type domain-containing protein n=1 Tax=Steinernema hermaphroditum TaxID=289476 RepID=A0AA39I222_9BILA|nr:hypothetical protein QR680_012056 [Steinernema hermaphroditum]
MVPVVKFRLVLLLLILCISTKIMAEEDDFCTLEVLELLAEVATRGTMDDRKVPKIMRDSAKHYRRHLLDQLKGQLEEVDQSDSNALEEINKTVAALAGAQVNQEICEIDDDEETRLDQISDQNDVMDMEDDSAEVITIESDDEDTQRGQSAETTTPTAEFRSGLWQCQRCKIILKGYHKENLLRHVGSHEGSTHRIACFIEGCRTKCKWGHALRAHLRHEHKLSARNLTAEQRDRLIEKERISYEKLELSLHKYFPFLSSRVDKLVERLWQCQVCQKQLIGTHEHNLLKHIGTHENIFSRCPIAGCAETCRTTSGLRNHLKNNHRLRAADLSAEQHGRLLKDERKFYESARNHLARYFPSGAKLQQQADHEAST